MAGAIDNAVYVSGPALKPPSSRSLSTDSGYFSSIACFANREKATASSVTAPTPTTIQTRPRTLSPTLGRSLKQRLRSASTQSPADNARDESESILSPQQSLVRLTLSKPVNLHTCIAFHRTIRHIALEPGWRYTRWATDQDDPLDLIIMVGWRAFAPPTWLRAHAPPLDIFRTMQPVLAGPGEMLNMHLLDAEIENRLPVRETVELTIVSGMSDVVDAEIKAKALEADHALCKTERRAGHSAARTRYSACLVQDGHVEGARVLIVLASAVPGRRTRRRRWTIGGVKPDFHGRFVYEGALGTSLEEMQRKGASLVTHRLRFQTFESMAKSGMGRRVSCPVM